MNNFENKNSYPSQSETSALTTEETAKNQWQTGERLEAMETILGYRVDARDLQDDPNLAMVYMIDDPEQAIAGLQSLQPTESAASEESNIVEVEAAPGVYEVYDKQTGELIDISGEGEN